MKIPRGLEWWMVWRAAPSGSSRFRPSWTRAPTAGRFASAARSRARTCRMSSESSLPTPLPPCSRSTFRIRSRSTSRCTAPLGRTGRCGCSATTSPCARCCSSAGSRERRERRLVEEAVAASVELGNDQGEHVVLHQDFHGGNVLRGEREPWLVIDPKPLVGERGFSSSKGETDIIESSRILVASA